jgi:tRNA 2-thiocytidine biosynthesis protein TtcA
LDCHKLAFGHHADDALHTSLLSLFYSGRLETLPPRLDFFEGQVSLIRPLIYVEERQLVRLARALDFPLQEAACPRADTSRRAWIRQWLGRVGPDYRRIRTNIWRAARRQSGF